MSQDERFGRDDFSAAYAETLRNNVTDGERWMTRASFLSVVLIVIYFLLQEESITEINIGITDIKDPSIIQLAIGPIFAYQYFAITNTALSILASVRSHSTILKQVFGSDIDDLWHGAWMPPNSLFSTTPFVLASFEEKRLLSNLQLAGAILRWTLLGFAPLLFIGYTTWETFRQPNTALDWASIGLSLFLTVLSLLNIASVSAIKFIPEDPIPTNEETEAAPNPSQP